MVKHLITKQHWKDCFTTKMIIKKCVAVLIVLQMAVVGQAQKSDSLEAIRTFVNVCNMYKKTPMHLAVRFNTETNYITNVSDTVSAQGEFYIMSDQAYIRFGEMEQLVSDSIALLVSDQQQRMIIFKDARPVIAQMKSAMGILISDSSLVNMSKKYTAFIKRETDDISIVELQTRQSLYGTNLPKETIEIRYATDTKQPSRVVTVKRKLIPLEQQDYDAYVKLGNKKNKVVSVADREWFLIKEIVSTFEYDKVEYDANVLVPVTIKDRIEKNEQGIYIPVKKYGQYAISTGN